jgi:multisubunit Na+/H+ antiporter MnhB subunit
MEHLNEVEAIASATAAPRALGRLAAALAGILCPEVVSARPIEDSFLAAFFRLIAPLATVVAGYILWVGKHAPGGAFQAGSILAGVGILALFATGFKAGTDSVRRNLALVLGLLAFCGVGLGMMGGSRSFLQYPTAWAGALILVIEAAATISIAAALVVLFIGCLQSPSAGRRPVLQGKDR